MGRERFNRIIGYSLSRPAAYFIVGLVFLAVVVAILGRWPAWVILASVAGGVVLLGLLVADSLFDPDVDRETSIADVDPGSVREPVLRSKVRRAMEYVRAAHKLARQDRTGVLASADDELPELEQAARSVYQMSLRLQEFRSDRILQRDLVDLEQRSKRGQLGKDQVAQLETLRRLEELVRSAEVEIDSAVAHLGRSYAEMQAIKVTPEFRGRAAEALAELGESTKRLGELASGYDQVYGARALGKEA